MNAKSPRSRSGARKKVKKKTLRKKSKKVPGKKSKKTPGKKSAKRPRKKATPPKARPPSNHRNNKAYGESEVATVRVPPPEASNASLRFHAGKDYIYDPDQRPASWWWENHYKHVPWATFRSWSGYDDWVTRREDHWRHVEAALGRKIASDVVREQASEVGQLAKVRTQALGLVLTGKDVNGEPVPLPPVKSYEGAVRAFIDVDKRLDEKRKLVLDELPLAITSGMASDSQIAGAGVAFNDEELRVMAQARMKHQQKQLEDGSALPSQKEEEVSDGDSAD